jgi:FdhD protein
MTPDDMVPMTDETAVLGVPALRVVRGVAAPTAERVVVEAPLQVSINGRAFAVTMRTPGADRELVRGHLLTEDILGPDATEYEFDEPVRDAEGRVREMNVRIPAVYLCEGVFDRRRLLTAAACGMCGQREWQELPDELAPLQRPRVIDATALARMFAAMRARQTVFDATGGCHAAAACAADGTLLCLYEDVGRHNAVDKVVGRMALLGRLPLDRTILMVSGRSSFEIMQKAAVAGVPIVCAVSAPSSLAADFAAQTGQTLVGFLRGDRMNVYAHGHRIAR